MLGAEVAHDRAGGVYREHRTDEEHAEKAQTQQVVLIKNSRAASLANLVATDT